MEHLRWIAGLLILMLSIGSFTNGAAGADERPEAEPNRGQNRSDELESFLGQYFATWSAGQMEEYKAHFHPYAIITYVQDGRVRLVMPRDEFVADQAEQIARAKVPMVERMTSFVADEDDAAASVSARWVLRRGEEVKTGVDRFTLIRDAEGRWKIIALLFYETKERAAVSGVGD